MEMFLMLVAMSFLGTAVSAALFAAATNGQRREGGPKVETRPAVPQRFFRACDVERPTSAPPVAGPLPEPMSLDHLLLQIERHVRLEQAAAESFHSMPNGRSLHSRTSSPLVN
jgi:hypothetical protein